MTEQPIIIATSLIPNDRLEVQTAAVQSWLNLGLQVVSLNCPKEIANLKDSFPNVVFVPQDKTGLEITGKPVVFISEILKYLGSQTVNCVGIVNSDIVLDQTESVVDKIEKNATTGFFFGPRLEVESFDTNNGEVDPWGFDYFFFRSSLAKLWPDADFCLGMPFWDHWFPLIPLLHGETVTRPKQPIGRHIPHPTSRDDSFFTFNDNFAAILIDLMNQAENSPQSGVHACFGRDFPRQDYFRLRQQAVIAETQGAPEQERRENLEALAVFFDDLTKYVIRFLNQHSNVV